ncbi:MAG TPA: alpha/beta fold hydrolase [Kiloniellales bacterium]|nr:alpha/beta fold hydrolase [Kiloniellales bacterium]
MARTHALPQPEEPGLRLHLRERRPAGAAVSTVLLVHGATFASTLWDVAVPDASFLDALAGAGCAAYALDIRGYGRSIPSSPPPQDRPYARATAAIRDIDLAVDFIRAREGRERIALLGGSWGTITCGLYAAGAGGAKLERLVLYAPLYSGHSAEWLAMIADPADPGRPNPALGACRQVTETVARGRWDAEIPYEDKGLWREERVFQAILADSLAAAGGGEAFPAPNGCLLDLFEVFSGRPLYEAGAIALPTLLVRGAGDTTSSRADALGLFDRLGSRVKRYLEIGHGAHFICAERNAWQVFDEVASFLCHPLRP